MERDVIDIVKEKEFIELTAAERSELADLCSSEDEFNQMKTMFAGIGAMDWSNPTPKAETKESLDHLFAKQFPKAAPVWYNAPLAVIAPKGKPFYRQPLVQAAAVGLLVFLAYPFIKSDAMTVESTQIAELSKDMNVSNKAKEKASDDVSQKLDKEFDANANAQAEKATVVENRMPSETFADEVDIVREVPAQPSPAISAKSDDIVSASVTATGSSVETIEMAFIDAVAPGSDHPDGVFIGNKLEVFSVPASREPAVFDLLTTTF